MLTRALKGRRGIWLPLRLGRDEGLPGGRRGSPDRAFAHTQGWHFLDLTEPLRAAVQDGEIWLYCYYDQSHWSPQGTAIAAEMLAAELLKIIRGNEEVRQ
jgi:hypothetical protein